MKNHIKTILCAFACILPGADLLAQDIDTTGIYRDRADTLGAAVFSARQGQISRFSGNRVETINAAGLCKMACCNLAESFENSASVTVGYSDAVTGARQIRLLGLSGTYTQMLDENRPVMRGLSAPFGLSYVPGQWLESIQIAKGATSVINGVESITGQINMEHRKPTDERPLFVNASFMSDTKGDLNLASSLQLSDAWSTVLLGHVSGNIVGMDGNGDGFLDDPRQLQFNFANRWLYYDPSGVQVRFGVSGLHERRQGGEADASTKMMYPAYSYENYMKADGPWGSNLKNTSVNAYLKVGIPLNADNSQNIAAVLDYVWQKADYEFGATTFDAGQHSAFVNVLYQNEVNENHRFTVGAGTQTDFFREDFARVLWGLPGQKDGAFARNRTQAAAGIFGEYTFHLGEKLSTIAGFRLDWMNGLKGASCIKPSPRFTIKYAPIEDIVLRANVGRGLRWANPLTDNIGVFSTSKTLDGFDSRILEDAWIFGGNISWYFKCGAHDGAYVSLDYFRTQFTEAAVVDYEHGLGTIEYYSLSGIGGRAFTDTWQLDFSCEPVDRFTITLTGRYTNAKTSMRDRPLVEKPMTSTFKGVLNLQYATNLNKWIFDFTASVNGPCRVYDFMKDCSQIKARNGRYYSPVYPLLYLQVTRRFKGVDLYIGGENLTNFHQKEVVLGRQDGSCRGPLFDASCVWGPLAGVRAYAGVRFTLWKTEK